MSLGRALFRPGKGKTIAQYTAGVADGAIDPGDWVALSITAPTSQGVSGVFEGETLLLVADFIEVSLCDTDTAGHEGLCLGVCMGAGIGAVSRWADVSAEVLADGDIAVIQCWGIHPAARQVASGVAGDQLATSSVAGEVTNSTSVAAADVGNAMVATAADLVQSTGTEDEGVTFVKCI